jgi:Tfp pilus assembly protein PilN
MRLILSTALVRLTDAVSALLTILSRKGLLTEAEVEEILKAARGERK